MLWFEPTRVPPGEWPFLTTTYAGLRELEASLTDSVDLTEGLGTITITGCLQAYRQAVVHRVLDQVQGVAATWNAGHPIASAVCARALLESLATFHSFLRRAQEAADRSDWEAISRLVNAYAFSEPPGRAKGTHPPDGPPRLGQMVKALIRCMQPGGDVFWDQICEVAHPNGASMMTYSGHLREKRFDARLDCSRESWLFPAIYNCVYSCCWLIAATLDFDILIEQVRTGEPLPDDHPLTREKVLTDRLVAELSPSGIEPQGNGLASS